MKHTGVAPALLFSGFLVAASSMVYELAIAQTISTLYGATILRYSLTIGLFIASLGAGALLWAQSLHKDPASDLFKLEVVLVALGAFSPILLFGVEYLQQQMGFTSAWTGLIGSHLIVAAIGIMSGMEIPALIETAKEFGKADWSSKIVAIDFLGACGGALMFPLALFPYFGLIAATVYSGAANGVAAVLALTLTRHPVGMPWKVALVLASICLIVTSAYEPQVREAIAQQLF